MPYEYEGDPYAIELPSPAPGPGVVPITNPPAGGDPRNADSVRQQAKVAVDFAAHVQSAVRLEIPQVRSTTTGVGRQFTNVVHSGAGTGTAKPTAGIALSGYRYKLLITLAGAVATAKFKVSLDGGKTYGAEHTTAASYTDASGVTIAFVGTFVLNDTYSFRGCDTPQAMWHTPGGKAREVIDHSGFLNGQVSSHREDWSNDLTAAIAAGTAGLLPGNSRWQYTLDTAAVDPSITLAAPNTDNLGNFNTLKISGSTTAAALVNAMISARPMFYPGANNHAECFAQALVRVPATSADQTIFFGFTKGVTSFSTAHPENIMFYAAGGGGTWHAAVQSFVLGGGTDVDTGIAPNSGAAADWQLLRVEYYGPQSEIGIALGGAVARFLIDGEQVAIHVGAAGSQIVSAEMYYGIGMNDVGHTPVDVFELGPITKGINWLADPVRM